MKLFSKKNHTISSKSIGDDYEHQAQIYLCKQGLKLIEKNYRCRYGEIDLIMRDDCILVFIEVRYRASQQQGHAAESINLNKQQKIITTAEYYLQARPHFRAYSCRFDVCAFNQLKASTEAELNWIKNAFMA